MCGRQRLQFSIKPIDITTFLLTLLILLYQFSVLVENTSRQFPCKLEKFHEKSAKWFSLKKMKRTIKNWYMIKARNDVINFAD